ncbi:hypothetical protein JI721_13265 [Alicyclobacillus cycloheptanicus]|uniref:Bacteriophage HK97-gp10, tail-component n=1 Tax=Alicyclobacillus cycloheptanicus TaxID=1457 RepID=A0ABT9XEE3_9BACL|nr:hypothetical protein [Alicyclobacillus cycloheptanicus]MDQ0188667.1 hypothetical protein [Alicyclobacillus cycloheptanicus]WDM00660.1 hypothetical protein JI721_13265 [Alicyclobacillus cycloheptanicus]
MGEWTWLHAVFPIADVELMQPPVQPKAANVLVRTVRKVPQGEPLYKDGQADGTAEGRGSDAAGSHQDWYEIRVAPHNVAPFRGGPWRAQFTKAELENPGEALYRFRARLAEAVARAEAQSPR